MLLVFGDKRFDLGQFVDLMPQRSVVAARQFRSAPSTFGRLERDDFVALVGRNQGPLVLGVTRLTAPFLLRFRRRFHRLRMRMLSAGRQRRILRRLPQSVEFRFQLGNPPLIVLDDRLNHRAHVGRQRGKLLRTDRRRRHTPYVADSSIQTNPNFHPEP